MPKLILSLILPRGAKTANEATLAKAIVNMAKKREPSPHEWNLLGTSVGYVRFICAAGPPTPIFQLVSDFNWNERGQPDYKWLDRLITDLVSAVRPHVTKWNWANMTVELDSYGYTVPDAVKDK